MVKEKFRANFIDYLWFCGERHGFRINGDSLLGILLGSIVFLPLLKVVDILNLNVSFGGNGGSMLEFAGFLFPFLFCYVLSCYCYRKRGRLVENFFSGGMFDKWWLTFPFFIIGHFGLPGFFFWIFGIILFD